MECWIANLYTYDASLDLTIDQIMDIVCIQDNSYSSIKS